MHTHRRHRALQRTSKVLRVVTPWGSIVDQRRRTCSCTNTATASSCPRTPPPTSCAASWPLLCARWPALPQHRPARLRQARRCSCSARLLNARERNATLSFESSTTLAGGRASPHRCPLVAPSSRQGDPSSTEKIISRHLASSGSHLAKAQQATPRTTLASHERSHPSFSKVRGHHRCITHARG